jgi:hypothetical protein
MTSSESQRISTMKQLLLMSYEENIMMETNAEETTATEGEARQSKAKQGQTGQSKQMNRKN